jgi:peptidoglycan/xylan/chitin deacetylase (PgdA/CDA1 family)
MLGMTDHRQNLAQTTAKLARRAAASQVARILFCGVMGLLAGMPAFAGSSFAWPEGHHAAISLTYDDAIAASDLEVALPQLDRAKLKGTFFLMGKAMSPADIPRWRALAASGHELGNHTVNHPCTRGTFPMPSQYNSESYNVEVLLTEIRVMNTLLTAIDGKTKHAFATPCAQTTVGGQDYIAPLRSSGLATFIRDPTTTAAGAKVPKIMGTGFVDVTGADMIAWTKQVEASGGLGVIVFHGVGGDYLAVSAEAHQQLLDYLAAHRADIWITTFSEAMAYVTAREHRTAP